MRDLWRWYWDRRVPAVRPIVTEREELSDQHMAAAIEDRIRLEARYQRINARVAVLKAERDAMQERDG